MLPVFYLIGRFLEWATFFAFGLAFGLYWKATSRGKYD